MTFTGKRPRPRRAALLLLLAAAALLVTGCSDFNIRTAVPPDAASSQGQAVRNLYDIVFVIGAAIFFLVEGLILFAVLRYRRRKGDDELPAQIHGNNRLEIVWTAIPIAIVLALFVAFLQTLTPRSRRRTPLRSASPAYQCSGSSTTRPRTFGWRLRRAQNKASASRHRVPPPAAI